MKSCICGKTHSARPVDYEVTVEQLSSVIRVDLNLLYETPDGSRVGHLAEVEANIDCYPVDGLMKMLFGSVEKQLERAVAKKHRRGREILAQQEQVAQIAARYRSTHDAS